MMIILDFYLDGLLASLLTFITWDPSTYVSQLIHNMESSSSEDMCYLLPCS